MATAIPATKAAILTVLAARPGLSGVALHWALPTKDEDFAANSTNNTEMVFLGAGRRSSDWADLGSGRRTEDFTVDLVVWVVQWGDDPQTAETRAFALWDEVEDALRDDIRADPSTLRTAGVLHFNGITNEIAASPYTEKWAVQIDASIEFQARNV